MKERFLDISKAFDHVWYKGLLFKLKQAGINATILQWLSNYLSDRQQRFLISGGNSSWLPVEAGVPQGSILGPLLFLIYINDKVFDICSSVRLFADDTNLYLIVDNPAEAARCINSDRLVEKFGKGKNSSIIHHTSYVQLYEECVDRIQAHYKICLISVLLNSPAMPRSGDATVAFIQQCVGVTRPLSGLHLFRMPKWWSVTMSQLPTWMRVKILTMLTV